MTCASGCAPPHSSSAIGQSLRVRPGPLCSLEDLRSVAPMSVGPWTRSPHSVTDIACLQRVQHACV